MYFTTNNTLDCAVLAPVTLFNSNLEDKRISDLANKAWEDFPWEDRGAPRRECFFSEVGEPYSYGSGAGKRTYWPRTAPEWLAEITKAAEDLCGCKFELCFANGYATEREHLGWHADNSDEVDDERPIAVMSLGAVREIWVKANGATADEVEKIALPSGSLFVMGAGMQDTHVHRIPKNSAKCGFRVSLTWRGAA